MFKFLSLRAQILLLLSVSIVVAGFLSFRSTISFLRQDKVFSLRELQALSVSSVLSVVGDNVEALRDDLRSQVLRSYQSPDQLGQPVLNVASNHQGTWSKIILRRTDSSPVLVKSLLFDSNQKLASQSGGAGVGWELDFVGSPRQLHFRDRLVLGEGRETYEIEGWMDAAFFEKQVQERSLESVAFSFYSLAGSRDRISEKVFGSGADSESGKHVQDFLSDLDFSNSAIQVQSKTLEEAGDTHYVSWGVVSWPSSKTKFLVSFSSRESQLLAAFRAFIIEQIYLLLIVLFATLYVGYQVSRVIVRPVEDLVGAVSRIETGDFSARVNLRGANELGRLGLAFNNMGQALKEREEALEKSEGNVRKLSFHSEFMNRLNRFVDTTARTLDLAELEVQVSELWFETLAIDPLINSMALYRFEVKSGSFVKVREAGRSADWDAELDADTDASAQSTGFVEYSENHFAFSVPAENGLRYLLLFSNFGQSFSDSHRVFFDELRGHLSSAFENARRYIELHEKSVRDGLTGLFNVRFFKESFQKELERAQAQSSQLGFLFFDVDHFKKYNDTHGHPAGDQVLRQMAALMRGYFAAEDVIARYGGEEFVVLLKGADLAHAAEKAEGFRALVELSDFENAHTQPLGRVTVSIGVSVYPAHGTSVKDVIQQADDALYEAKKLSRNCVVAAGAPKNSDAA